MMENYVTRKIAAKLNLKQCLESSYPVYAGEFEYALLPTICLSIFHASNKMANGQIDGEL